MYIEYIRNQQTTSTFGILQGSADFSCPRPYRGENRSFRPTWLVRVSDMTAVPGSSVTEEYWALSYSWSQSGELIHKGGEDYDRIDEGKHQITEYRRIEGHTMKARKPFDPDVTTHSDFDPDTAVTKFVSFEKLVQQVCKDFGINYIWFDQICINQGDHDAKMQEIKQMHNIYKNARCTVALVPELQWTFCEDGELSKANTKDISRSEWCTRIWTLEEAFLSKNILFLGRNVHIWSDIDLIWSSTYAIDSVITKYSGTEWIACTVLWYARSRTSSKSHDRIFALANIFPELMHGIKFSYKQPVHDLMIKFYCDLAEKDVSILLFGAPAQPDPENQIMESRRKEASTLPSWTGASGAHVVQIALKYGTVTGAPPYTIERDCMRLTSSFFTVRIEPANAVEIPEDFNNSSKYETILRLFGGGHSIFECYETKDAKKDLFTVDGLPVNDYDASSGTKYHQITTTDNDSAELTFAAVANKPVPIYTDQIQKLGLKTTHFLPLITKEEDKIAINTLTRPTYCGGFLSLTEECSRCIVLLDPHFRDEYCFHIYPVLKEEKGCYKSIGTCIILNEPQEHFASMIQPEQTFKIM